MALTKQEVFDKVATHLLTQKAVSRSFVASGFSKNEPGCAYRGVEGRMCAVGCLIPEDTYVEEMEGKAAHALYDSFFEVRQLFDSEIPPAEICSLLARLQAIHDCSSVEYWKGELESLAHSKELDPSVLKKFEQQDGTV